MILYKYYSLSQYTDEAIIKQGLWCHTPRHMNDPFESLIQLNREFSSSQLEIFREVCRSNPTGQKWSELSDQHLITFFNHGRKFILKRYAFCAFSEKYDDILMWSHYTDSHKGFVVGFDLSNLAEKYHLTKVTYDNKLPDLDTKLFAEFMCKNTESVKDFIRDYSIKSDIWKYEREWRLWQDGPGYIHYFPSQIKEIYFGLNITTENAVKILKLIQFIKNVEIYKIDIDTTQSIKLIRTNVKK